MKWNQAHPRVVRGEAVHEPQEEKKTKQQLKKQIYEEVVEEIQNVGIRNLSFESNGVNIEELLAPEVNFVETKETKKLKNKIKMWLKLGHPVHIVGPTGCGKTTLAIQAAKEINKKVLWINGDEEMSTTDLIGGYSEVETNSLRDKYVHNVLKTRDIYKAGWVDNPLTLACKNGYALVYNEFARSLPQANNVLLSVFEEKILELPTKFGPERYVKVHPDFITLFTSNSIEYAGVHKPQDALLDRMIGVYMDYYDFDTEVKIVQTHSKIPKTEAEKVVTIIKKLREKLKDGEKPGTRAAVLFAQGMEAMGKFKNDNYKNICLDVLASKVSGVLDYDKKRKVVNEVLKGI